MALESSPRSGVCSNALATRSRLSKRTETHSRKHLWSLRLLLLFFHGHSLFLAPPPARPSAPFSLFSLHLSVYLSTYLVVHVGGAPVALRRFTYLPVVLLTPRRPITLHPGVGGGRFKGISTIFGRESPGRLRAAADDS